MGAGIAPCRTALSPRIDTRPGQSADRFVCAETRHPGPRVKTGEGEGWASEPQRLAESAQAGSVFSRGFPATGSVRAEETALAELKALVFGSPVAGCDDTGVLRGDTELSAAPGFYARVEAGLVSASDAAIGEARAGITIIGVRKGFARHIRCPMLIACRADAHGIGNQRVIDALKTGFAPLVVPRQGVPFA